MDAIGSKKSDVFFSTQDREKLMDKLMDTLGKGKSINGIEVILSGKKFEISDGSIESIMRQFKKGKKAG